MTAETTEATASPSLTAPPVTCGTPTCEAAFLDGYSYASSWHRAVENRWGINVIGLRMCPDCMDARIPTAGMYVADADLAGWIKSLHPDPDPHADLEAKAERMAAPDEPVPAVPPVPTAPAVSLVPAVQVIPEPEPGSVAEFAAELHMPPVPDLGPEREKNLAVFLEAHDAHDAGQDAAAESDGQPEAPDATAVIPAQSADTEAIPAITADTEGKSS